MTNHTAQNENQQKLMGHIQNQKRQIELLRGRVSRLEALLEVGLGDPMIHWLFKNRSERMDATLPIYAEDRRNFHLARYEFAARYADSASFADIACGTGYGTKQLIEQGKAASGIGIDVCKQAIEYASLKHSCPEIQYICADGEATGLENATVDLVVSFETIEHVQDDRRLLNEFARILRPGGKLICSTPNNWPLEIAPHHVRVYDRESFSEKLGEHFKIEEMFNQNSGSEFKYNHQQPQGIIPTDDENARLAECFIAVCTKK